MFKFHVLSGTLLRSGIALALSVSLAKACVERQCG